MNGYVKPPPREVPLLLTLSLASNARAIVGSILFALSGLAYGRLGLRPVIVGMAIAGGVLIVLGALRGFRDAAVLRDGKVVAAAFEGARTQTAAPVMRRITPQQREQLAKAKPALRVALGCALLPFVGMGILFAGIGAWMLYNVAVAGKPVTINDQEVRDASVAIPQIIPFIVIGLVFAFIGGVAFVVINRLLTNAARALPTADRKVVLAGAFVATHGARNARTDDRIVAEGSQVETTFPMIYDDVRGRAFLVGGERIPARLIRGGEWEEKNPLAGRVRLLVVVASLLIGLANFGGQRHAITLTPPPTAPATRLVVRGSRAPRCRP